MGGAGQTHAIITPLRWPTDVDDDALLTHARTAKNGDLFSRLWSGDRASYDSPSEADQALCSLLAFWTGADADRMDRWFRASGLCRDKWDARRGDTTYGQRTIATAIASCRDVYRGPTRRETRSADVGASATSTVPSAS